jgi:hypothetical protein
MPFKVANACEQDKQGAPKLLGHVLTGVQQRHRVRIVLAIEDEVKLDKEPGGRSYDPKRVEPRIPV